MKRLVAVEADNGIKVRMAISVDSRGLLTRDEVRELLSVAVSECMRSMELLPYIRVRIAELKRIGTV